jgi:hypothetical protein
VTEHYYIRSRGRVQGPFTAEKLRELATRGRFARHFEVSADGNIWSLASGFPALFPTPTERKVRAAPTAQTSAGLERGRVNRELSKDPVIYPLDVDCWEVPATQPPDQEWHYIRNGATHGPVLFPELRRLASVGELTGQDYVWAEGMPDWLPAANVPHLFSPAAAQANGGMTYATSAATRTSSAAIASLVFGLMATIILPFFGGVLAVVFGGVVGLLAMTILPLLGSVLTVVFGHLALKEIGRSQGTMTGRAMAIVGLVLGYLVVGATVVVGGVFFVLVIIGAAARH